MNYIALNQTLRRHKMRLFTLEDIKNLFPAEKAAAIKNNLTRWVKNGYFARLKKDVYEVCVDSQDSGLPDLYIANKIYQPSYVSLETALSIYGIIPDVAAAVTSVSTQATRSFKNKYGAFFYRTCAKKAFIGYKLIIYEGFKVNIADKEKALADFLYYRLRGADHLDFSAERLNRKFLKQLNWEKALSYAKLFNKKTVSALRQCKGYALC